MGFTILNPVMLFFSALVALPIIIHLFHRRRFKEVRWAAMEFLLKAEKKTKSMHKLRHLLLLILRCLAILFVVLAISQPLIKTPSLAGLKGKASNYAVIILDNSFSMSEKDGSNKVLFDAAKEKASEMVGLFEQGDSISLLTFGKKAKTIINEPTYQLSTVKKEVESVKLENGGNDLGGALLLAAGLFKKSKEVSKELYIITDCQATAFRDAEKDIKQVFDEIGGKVTIYLVKVGKKNPGNLSVSNVRFSRQLVDTVMPIRITADITNYGKSDVMDCVANLYTNEKLRDSKRIIIKSGRTEPIAFYHRFSEEGINTGRIEISTDAVAKDNEVYFSVNVRGAVPVLIVDGKPSRKRFESESGFLSYAFSPYGPEDAGKGKLIASSVCDYAALSQPRLNANKVVVLSSIPYLSEEGLLSLGAFVRSGKGALFFAGDLINPQYFNAQFYKEKSGILPCLVGGKITPKKEGDTFFIDKVNLEHPLMAKFREAEIKELKKARFAEFFELKVDPTDPTTVILASFNNGMPAVVSKQCGKGNTIIIATGANRRWSDFVIKPMFLPWLYETVYFLSSGTEEQRNMKLGEKIRKVLPFGSNFTAKLITPDNKQAVFKSSISAEGRVLEYSDTNDPGFYKVQVQDKNDFYALNLETKSESDTERAEKSYIMRLAPKERFIYIGEEEDARSKVLQGRNGIGIWKELLLLAALILGAESYLAYRFGKRI